PGSAVGAQGLRATPDGCQQSVERVGERRRLGWSHFRRPASLALLRDDLAVDEELATPHAPWLGALQRGVEARSAHLAAGAERLRAVDVVDLLREEQLEHRAGTGGAAGERAPLLCLTFVDECF